MKKLIAVILILAMLLPAAALAENLHVSNHYTMFIDMESFLSGKYSGATVSSDFTFDSMTYDLFMMSDGSTGYLIQTQCVSGIFLNSGMIQVTMMEINGQMILVDNTGTHMNVMKDDETEDLWLDFGYGYFRMRPVETISNLYDRM